MGSKTDFSSRGIDMSMPITEEGRLWAEVEVKANTDLAIRDMQMMALSNFSPEEKTRLGGETLLSCVRANNLIRGVLEEALAQMAAPTSVRSVSADDRVPLAA